ncbi:MAG: hypothetical protein ABIW84_04125, partial [Ilumatobacteraceae bacterium]
MHGLLRLRMLLARRPFIYWLFVAVLAFAIALPVASAVEDVQLERASWGEVATVYVATAPIEPGD